MCNLEQLIKYLRNSKVHALILPFHTFFDLSLNHPSLWYSIELTSENLQAIHFLKNSVK